MRAKVAVVAAAAALMLGACSALTGLDAISERACAPDCSRVEPDASLPLETDGASGSLDGTVLADTGEPRGDDGEATRDVSTSDDVFTASDVGGDDDSGPPMTLDSGAMDSGSSVNQDSGVLDSAARDTGSPDGRASEGGTEDSGTADTGHSGDEDSGSTGDTDAGADEDADCGPVDTISACGACGNVCSDYGGVPSSCTDGGCVYSCSADYLDCNGGTAPNTDGCECSVAGAGVKSCCGTSCPIAHSWDLQGINDRYYACEPLGTMNQALAQAACDAALGSPSVCRMTTCYNPDDLLSGGVVCGVVGTVCDCWAYADTTNMPAQMGHFSKSSDASRCVCPVAASTPMWD